MAEYNSSDVEPVQDESKNKDYVLAFGGKI